MENIDFYSHYQQFIRKNQAFLWAGVVICIFLGAIAVATDTWLIAVLGIGALLVFTFIQHSLNEPYRQKLKVLQKDFPSKWKEYLEQHSTYYADLTEGNKEVFNKRIHLFLSNKRIIGVDTEVEEEVKLLVAASAIIPTFAFPFFEYPNVKEVLIYPNAFDTNFQTDFQTGEEGHILGMVGNGVLNNTVLLSKPDLIAGFSGQYDKQNVGIHEFVHLLDKADGATDGLPEIFLSNTYTLPWLKALKEETQKMREGSSDINSYGLTNNAEFFSVVSEYFFDNPAKFRKRHLELYQVLSKIYHQETDPRGWLRVISKK